MKIIKAIFCTLIVCVLLEIIARVFVHEYSDTGFPKGKNTGEYSHLTTPHPHQGIVFSLKKNLDIYFKEKKFTTNSTSFRGAEFKEKADQFRIVGIGDSVMMGWGVADNDTYLSIIEEKLKSSEMNVDVLNLAVLGYNTTQEYYTLKNYGLDLKPDLVILHYVGNDFEGITYTTKVKNLWWNSPLYFINAMQLSLIVLSGNYDENYRYELRPIIKPKNFKDDFFTSLNGIIKLTRKNRIPLLVVLGSRYLSWGVKHSEIEELFNSYGIEVVNLFEIYRDLDESVPIHKAVSVLDEHNKKYLIQIGPGRDNHPNELWHKDTAEILLEKIKKYIKR